MMAQLKMTAEIMASHFDLILSPAKIIIAIIAAWIFAYITNKIYVFESTTNNLKELMKEIVSFVGCRLATAIIEMLLMNLFVTIWKFDYMLMKIIVNIIIIILNFVFSKLIIFKNKDNKGEVENG